MRWWRRLFGDERGAATVEGFGLAAGAVTFTAAVALSLPTPMAESVAGGIGNAVCAVGGPCAAEQSEEVLLADRKFIGQPAGSGKPPVVVPDNWIQTPAKNGQGTVYTNPANPNEQIRIMERGRYNPDGYIRNRDSSGSYVDPSGRRVPKNDPAGHVDPRFRGPLEWFKKLRVVPGNLFLLPNQRKYLEDIQRCGMSPCPAPVESSTPVEVVVASAGGGPLTLPDLEVELPDVSLTEPVVEIPDPEVELPDVSLTEPVVEIPDAEVELPVVSLTEPVVEIPDPEVELPDVSLNEPVVPIPDAGTPDLDWAAGGAEWSSFDTGFAGDDLFSIGDGVLVDSAETTVFSASGGIGEWWG